MKSLLTIRLMAVSGLFMASVQAQGLPASDDVFEHWWRPLLRRTLDGVLTHNPRQGGTDRRDSEARYFNPRPSPWEFMVHVVAHIERVALIGSEICRGYPAICEGLKPAEVRRLLRQFHDQEKLNMDPEFTERIGLGDLDQHPFFFLWARWGRRLSEAERGPITLLNSAAQEVRALIFVPRAGDPKKFREKQAAAYARIELIADIIDTRLSPERRRELNIADHDPKFGDWLPDPTDRAIAEHLALTYERLTEPLRFGPVHRALEPLHPSYPNRLPWLSDAPQSCATALNPPLSL